MEKLSPHHIRLRDASIIEIPASNAKNLDLQGHSGDPNSVCQTASAGVDNLGMSSD
jgi:hypothetical protein